MSGATMTTTQLYQTQSYTSPWIGTHLGFSYNGRHSSEFNIVRVSSSNRYDDNLLPQIQDKTVQVPGGDGTYYFGSYYTQRQFSLNIAFENLSEAQLRNLRLLFSDKKLHPLIFDEFPYKVYEAKVSTSPNFKYIAFPAQNNTRYYNGEASISFTCPFPFARTPNNYKYYTALSGMPIGKSASGQSIKVESLAGYQPSNEWLQVSGIKDRDRLLFNKKNGETDTSIQDNYHLSYCYDRLYQDMYNLIMPVQSATDKGNYAINTDEYKAREEVISEKYKKVFSQANIYNKFQSELQRVYKSDYVTSGTIYAGLLEHSVNWSTYITTYNPGDLPTDWELKIKKSLLGNGAPFAIMMFKNGGLLVCDAIQVNANDSGVIINSKTRLIEGYDANGKTGRIYNQYINAGEFFKIIPAPFDTTAIIDNTDANLKKHWSLTYGEDLFMFISSKAGGQTYHDLTADLELTYDYLYY